MSKQNRYIYSTAAHLAHQQMERALNYPPNSDYEFRHTHRPANHTTLWIDGKKVYDSQAVEQQAAALVEWRIREAEAEAAMDEVRNDRHRIG